MTLHEYWSSGKPQENEICVLEDYFQPGGGGGDAKIKSIRNVTWRQSKL